MLYCFSLSCFPSVENGLQLHVCVQWQQVSPWTLSCPRSSPLTPESREDSRTASEHQGVKHPAALLMFSSGPMGTTVEPAAEKRPYPRQRIIETSCRGHVVFLFTSFFKDGDTDRLITFSVFPRRDSTSLNSETTVFPEGNFNVYSRFPPPKDCGKNRRRRLHHAAKRQKAWLCFWWMDLELSTTDVLRVLYRGRRHGESLLNRPASKTSRLTGQSEADEFSWMFDAHLLRQALHLRGEETASNSEGRTHTPGLTSCTYCIPPLCTNQVKF